MSYVLKCICCGAPSVPMDTSNVGQMQRITGYDPVWISDGGLEWLCPADDCRGKATQASKLLREVFGDRLRYVHMLSIERLSRPEETK